MASQLVPARLHPIMVMDSIETQDAKPRVMPHQMLLQSLVASRQIEAGFVLLQQVGTRVLSQSDEDSYPLLRIILQACGLVGDLDSVSRLQAAVEQLGLKACLCIAAALVQGSMQCWESATNIDGTWDAWQLWFELHKKMSYLSQLQVLPWGFRQCSTSRRPEGTLQIHAIKKAFFRMMPKTG